MPPTDAKSEADDGGLPGELVQQVARRLQDENADLREYGYRLALVQEDGDGVPLDAAAASVEAPDGDGHWSEVEVQKLPNNELRIRLRGYREADGDEQKERMARLVRALLRETLL